MWETPAFRYSSLLAVEVTGRHPIGSQWVAKTLDIVGLIDAGKNVRLDVLKRVAKLDGGKESSILPFIVWKGLLIMYK